MRGEEHVHGSDRALPKLLERRGIVRQDLLRSPMSSDRVSEHRFGVRTVLRTNMSGRADVEPGGVIEELIDRHRLTIDQVVFEGIELP